MQQLQLSHQPAERTLSLLRLEMCDLQRAADQGLIQVLQPWLEKDGSAVQLSNWLQGHQEMLPGPSENIESDLQGLCNAIALLWQQHNPEEKISSMQQGHTEHD